jgi:hypothetical protein
MNLDFKRLIEASSAFFSRKFDYTNPSSMKLMDEIDIIRTRTATGNLTRSSEDITSTIMLTQLRSDAKERNLIEGSEKNPTERLCLEMSSLPGSRTQLVPCNISSTLQWFTVGMISYYN